MEENVALDSKKQKKFDKSIKGIKKLLKKKEAEPHKPAVLAPKDDNKKGDKKRKRKERGLVYLSHIPHGFYEHEMTQYFKQFGMVTNVRVIRSPRTGRSKGFAFVEFREPAVAEIVAETMNNYLMGKRLIKAAIIPPEKQKHRVFKQRWSSKNNPTTNRRIKARKAYNAPKTDAEHLVKAKKMLANLQKNKKKLSDLGIDYSFFTPVDVPEELSQKVAVKVETDNKKVKVKSDTEAKKTKNEPEGKQNKNKKTKATEDKLVKDKKPEVKSKPDKKNKTEVMEVQQIDKTKQNEKQKKMQKAGLKLPENFIKVGEDEDKDSDSSLDFDSDEYEKMLQKESDASSGEESEDDDDDSDGEEESDDGEEESDDGEEESDDGEEESDEEDSEEELPPLIPVKEKKGKKPVMALSPKKVTPITVARAQKQPVQKPAQKSSKPNAPRVQQQPQVLKRKNLQPEVSPKKPKFEKKDKPRNKQFKKKNKA